MVTRNGNGHASAEANLRRLFRLDSDPRAAPLLDAFVSNVVSLRQEFNRYLHGTDPRRSIPDECGYPTSLITPEVYQDLYDTDPIASRVVGAWPDECWASQPLVYETDDSEVVTPFERAWDALGKQLRGENSHYREEEGSPVWEILHRADVVSGIGQYGVILIGLDDGLDLRLPARGVQEQYSVPAGKDEKGNPLPEPGVNRPYRLTVNASETRGRKVIYMDTFPETLALVTQWESNFTSPRFGQPVMYQISFGDPRGYSTGVGAPMSTKQVHWTRVVHLADTWHHAPVSKVLAVPRLRPVYNRIYDLQKIYGADGEGFWRNSILKLFFETHPELGGDVEIDREAFRDEIEKMLTGLQQYMATSGLSAKAIPPAVSDPAPHVAAHIEAICIKIRMAVRIFKGSERGELASSQDERGHKERVTGRKTGYLTPQEICPFIDRLVLLGVLPAPAKKQNQTEPAPKQGRQSPLRRPVPKGQEVPNDFRDRFRKGPPPEEEMGDERETEREEFAGKFGKEKPLRAETPGGYVVEWPDVTSATEAEKVSVLAQKTAAYAQYIAGGVEAMIPPLDYMTKFDDLEEEEAQSILDNAEGALAEREEEDALAQQEEMDRQQEKIERGLAPDPTDPDQQPPQSPPFGGGSGKPPFGPKKPNPFTGNESVANAFCATGEGGGVDPTCSPGGGGTGMSPEKELELYAHLGQWDKYRKLEAKLETQKGKPRGAGTRPPKGRTPRAPDVKVKAAADRVARINTRVKAAQEKARQAQEKVKSLRGGLKAAKAELARVKAEAKVSPKGKKGETTRAEAPLTPVHSAEQREASRGRREGAVEQLSSRLQKARDWGDADRSAQVASAVKVYTRGEYGEKANPYVAINKQLREGKEVGEVKTKGVDAGGLEKMQESARSLLPEPAVIYRGISERTFRRMYGKLKEGATVEARGFSSATLDPQIAVEFSDEKDSNVVLEISARRGLYAEGRSATAGEYEVIQAHGTRYHYRGTEEANVAGHHVRVVKLEEVE